MDITDWEVLEEAWVLYLVIAISAGAIIWAIESVGMRISDRIISVLRTQHDDVDRIIGRLHGLEGSLVTHLEQVCTEIR